MLVLHFLNVGHGDCTFIEFPSGRLMMVDINNSKSLPEEDVEALASHTGISKYAFKNLPSVNSRSWEEYYRSLLVDPYDYYQENFSGKGIFRYIQTHPDMDHMGGLHRFFWQEKVPLSNFWDVEHAKELEEENFKFGPHSYLDWIVYQLLRGGNGPEDDSGNDSEHRVMHIKRDGQASYWAEDGIEVLSPTADLIEACNESGSYNECSYVLKISYAGRSIILPGDAERSAWNSMLAHYPKEEMKCDILKAAHHGRKSGYHQEAVETMNPSIVICSVGKKPDTDASSEYSRVADNVLSTRYHGTIKVTVWHDGDIWVDNHAGARIATIDS